MNNRQESDRMRQRFPSHVYRHGDEPDPRFSLANERTFLAWARTALALLALAVALLTLDVAADRGTQLVLGTVFALAGIATIVLGWISWASTERALRLRRPLPGAGTAALLTACLVMVAATVAMIVGLQT